MRRFLSAGLFCICLGASAVGQVLFSKGSWPCYGGNAQHTAFFNGSSQTVKNIHWQTSLDDNRSYYGGEVLMHYSSPIVSPYNTVVHSYRFTTSNNGTPYYNNWEVMGRSGLTGQLLWTMSSDYSAPQIFPSNWTSVFPLSLVNVRGYQKLSFGGLFGFQIPVVTTGVVAAGSGGTLLVRSTADTALPNLSRFPFYTSLRDYNVNSATYSSIIINTPLTADASGNVYFGYTLNGGSISTLPGLGTGGVAKVNVSTGVATYTSVQSLNISSSLGEAATNAAPALSNDGQYLYVALCPTGGGGGYLAKLNTSNLTKAASVATMDPWVTGGFANLLNISSASPMVGPDGHVFMGVFDNGWRESHGWMLQFDGNLKQTNSSGVTYPIGAFGWDDTPSVVPSSMVASYKGKAPYLILTKYNNYAMGGDAGANGYNHVALLDPTSNSVTRDRQSGIAVMNEVLLVLSPTPNPDLGGFDEWCINSAAVDLKKNSAIINCEDGHVYRWSFANNTITEALNLQPPTGEAYTSTVIGPDGTIFAINNSLLFAVGN